MEMSPFAVKKFFAFFLCLLFPLTVVPSPGRAREIPSESNASLALSSLAVPEEIGKVQERFTGTGTRTIIQIQDVHAHAVAQQNIAATLERLRAMFGIKTAALEGAWTATSLSKSHSIPTSREKQLLAGALLEDDRISGPIYAAIMSPEPILLFGIEDARLYEKNRSLFLAHLKKIKETHEKLQGYGASLQASQQSSWNPDLLAFGALFGKFRETSDLGKFLPLLLKTADELIAASSDLTQVLLLKDIMAAEKSLAHERLEKEIQQVIKKYTSRPWTLEELIRGGKIPPEEIGFYPEIKKLARLYKMKDQLSLTELMEQIETLTGRVLEKLAHSPEEKAVWERTERFYLAKKILLLQATPADMKAYEGEKPLLENELAAAGLSEPLALSADFYETVKKRDEIFFQKIMTDPALSGDIAVITGGFHTDGLSRKFRAAGISYITIAPGLGGTAMDEKLYNERMTENHGAGNGKRRTPSVDGPRVPRPASAGAQTLSELGNRLDIDEDFVAALEVQKKTNDVRRAKMRFMGTTAAVSKNAKPKDIARKKLLRKDPGPGVVLISNFQASKFMALPRPAQLEIVRQWMTEADQAQQKVMLASSVSVLVKMMPASPQTLKLLAAATQKGDIIALAQDIPAPAEILSMRGIERFKAKDVPSMIAGIPRFRRLAKEHFFAVMKNDYKNGALVVLPEHPSSLVLYRIVTLDERLYQSAKNPEFLALLQGLVIEILSQELSSKAA